MEEIRVNRLPLLTYRYLHTNDTPMQFEAPEKSGEPVFSDIIYVKEGGELPEDFNGASKETVKAAADGRRYTITVPAHAETSLTITLKADEAHPDFAGQFVFYLGEEAKLSLVWRIEGEATSDTCLIAAYYDLKEGANLSVSRMEKGLTHATIYDQRHTHLARKAKAVFLAAELGGQNVIVHSYGKLEGDKSTMQEKAVYAARGDQHLDFFCHIDHIGKKTNAKIDIKGALADTAKKIFRGTLNFKKGCSGSVGDEGDYAIQLDPHTKNISLPLLLCTEDDVVGNHASSAGQLDANTIYFLMTRGFSLEEARRIVVEALIRPIIDSMDSSLHDEVIEEVRRKLDSKEIK